MSRGTTRGIHTTTERDVLGVYQQIPRAALWDLLVAVLREHLAQPELDGADLLAAIAERYDPVRLAHRLPYLRLPSTARSSERDREIVLDVIDLSTAAATHGRYVDDRTVYDRLARMGWSVTQGRYDLRVLIDDGLVERATTIDGAVYRLTRAEWDRRRQLAATVRS